MNNKTRNIIASLYIVALLMLLIGTTFSFFTTIRMSSIKPAAEVSSAKTNEILFETLGSIEIYPNATNFKLGEDSLSSTVNANVYFTHSITDSATSEKYDIVLNIDKNNFEYTNKDDSNGTPELILEVIDPDNNPVTEIEGLTYVTVTDNKGKVINGFDITEFDKTELDKTISIVKNKEISTEKAETVTHKWQIIVTYVNLSASQNANYDKELSGAIQIKRADAS